MCRQCWTQSISDRRPKYGLAIATINYFDSALPLTILVQGYCAPNILKQWPIWWLGQSRREYHHWQSTGTMMFELGWFWTVLDSGHVGQCRSDRKPTMKFQFAYGLWPGMTLNCLSSRSLKLYIKCHGSGIENHPRDIDWHHDLWSYITLNRLQSRSLDSTSNISNTVLNAMDVR